MEIVLLGVTVISLLVALVMSVSAWRLGREEKRRSAARVAALSIAAAEKPAERPLPPTHTSNCVPAALVAARASSMSSARGSRSYALSRPVGWTSSEKRMSCVTVRLIEAKLAPS